MTPIACIWLAAAILGADGEVAAPREDWAKLAADYSEASRGRAMVVMYDGRIVFERYANGGSAGQVQMLASGSKSLVGLAAAAAEMDGVLRLDDKASGALSEWKDDPAKAGITYRELLSLTSGLTAGERGNAVRAPSWVEIAARPMTGRPGQRFEYGAYPINTFAYALERKLAGEKFEAYLKRRVLDPIGVRVDWRFRCADGHPQVGGGAFMTARDWATLGELVRNEGVKDGRQVIAAESLRACFEGTEQNPAYGLTWWLKKPVPAELLRAIPLIRSEWGGVANSDWLPDDLVAACGAGKQRLYVIPSRKLVVVRQGQLARQFSDVEFLDRLLQGKVSGE